MRACLALVRGAGLLAVAHAFGSTAPAETSGKGLRPHIVSILQDDLGWWDSGVHNPAAAAWSQNITSLAKQGITLAYHYTHWHCSPSRRSFLSGRLPIHHGEQLSSNSGDDIDLRMDWVSDKLDRAGYECHWFGKWHTGFRSYKHLPLQHGFRHAVGSLQTGGAYSGPSHTIRWEDEHPLVSEEHFVNKPSSCLPAAGAAPGSGMQHACRDKAGFKDQFGTCNDYVTKKWCAGGGVGPSWQASWGSLSLSVARSCCACGRGHSAANSTGSAQTPLTDAIYAACDDETWLQDQNMQCGSRLQYAKQATSALQCCAECTALAACTHWVFDTSRGMDIACHLKSGSSDCAGPRRGVTSGRKGRLRRLSGKKGKQSAGKGRGKGKGKGKVISSGQCVNEYSTDLWGSMAVRAVQDFDSTNHSAALYVHLCFEAMHTPYSKAPGDPTGNVYRGMLWRSDVYVGKLLEQLHAKNMYDKTLIVYMSDNGGTEQGNNYPLRGEKHSNWEGAMRTTAFVSGGLVPSTLQGTTSQVTTHIVDWYATFAVLAGVSPLNDPPAAPLAVDPASPRKDIYGENSFPPVDGVNVWPMLMHPKDHAIDSAHPNLVLTKEVVISGRWKLLVSQPHFKSQQPGWKTPQGQWRKPNASETVGCQAQDVGPAVSALPGPGKGAPCLFDLRADPYEHKNVASRHAGVVAKLWAVLNHTVLGQRDCQGWSYKGTGHTIPGPKQGSARASTGGCSPPGLIGPCNAKCASKHWSTFAGAGAKLPSSSGAPLCGVPGCTAPAGPSS